jgi:polysaccharide export outer membrane protein
LKRLLPWSAPLRGLIVLLVFAAAPRLHAQAAPEAPVLRPGDLVRITVWKNDALSGEFVVGGDSVVAHPIYREVRAAGVPLAEVEAGVQRVLQRFEANPQFLVVPLFRVAVAGEVRQPDLLLVRPEVTLMQAVAQAGGVTERGRLDRVHLVRGGQDRVLNLTVPGVGDIPVRSGDQIRVDRRVSVFREYVAPAASVVAALAAVARLFISPSSSK